MSTRLRGVDVARALALVGMMGTHLLDEYGPDDQVSGFFVERVLHIHREVGDVLGCQRQS